MEKQKQTISQILSGKDLRATKQRKALMEILLEASLPLSAGQIYTTLKEELEDLQLSTVYRNLNKFAEKNLVRKLSLKPDEKEVFFESTISFQHHHHLICLKCREIHPLPCPEEYFSKIAKKYDYKISDHRLKVYGYCADCR